MARLIPYLAIFKFKATTEITPMENTYIIYVDGQKADELKSRENAIKFAEAKAKSWKR